MDKSTQKKCKVLIAPLNWGLGHATRCIPIIKNLQQQNIEVIIASDGAALTLLQQKFPKLQSIELPSYKIKYKYHNMVLNILLLFPNIIKAMYLERQKIKQIIKTEQINGIISDNRFGLWLKYLPSVFITHQLNIITPYKPISKLVNFINHKLIKKHTYSWIPDYQTKPGLAEALSHPPLENSIYIGPLSQLESDKQIISIDLLILLSGPEPQRSYFEEKIIQAIQADFFKAYKLVLVRGTFDKKSIQINHPNIEVHNFMGAKQLSVCMAQSNKILARSGYSTLMDIIKMQKEAVFVPTPGQTEQIYLAKQLDKFCIFPYQEQKYFDLKALILKADRYKNTLESFDHKALDHAVLLFKEKLSKTQNIKA